MAEFSIIEEFCHGIGPDHADTKLGVGDDAAIIAVPAGMELAISADSMVSGIHFFADVSPAKLAQKILAVNLSDMAAMGAEPKWATLVLTIPEFDADWLKAFSDSLKVIATRFNLQIIGGDTTQGPLNLSITIMGLLSQGQALCRSGAMLDDDVYVSQYVGDAALGLAVLSGEVCLTDEYSDAVVSALETPEPRVTLGQSLLGVASACLDISDGLVGDLGHICQQSRVSIDIDAGLIPLSDAYRWFIANGGTLDLALTGGDDYELAFTASPSQRSEIDCIAEQLGISLTRVGSVVAKRQEAVSVSLEGVKYQLPTSFEHFS
ncbi:MAG: thiamine-phosphate kinase [Arenicella sp.]|nr:thiamine-phosphate kinase [Arenicella sp.]